MNPFGIVENHELEKKEQEAGGHGCTNKKRVAGLLLTNLVCPCQYVSFLCPCSKNIAAISLFYWKFMCCELGMFHIVNGKHHNKNLDMV